jgi:hypothetical protein
LDAKSNKELIDRRSYIAAAKSEAAESESHVASYALQRRRAGGAIDFLGAAVVKRHVGEVVDATIVACKSVHGKDQVLLKPIRASGAAMLPRRAR